jgi:peptidoglycan/xylan/chitin deacetylase (PgdA/CDA1 family)
MTLHSKFRGLLKRRRKAPNTGVILLYHRVGLKDADPWGLAVEPRHFAAQMRLLQDLGCACALDQFDTEPARGRRIAVTFDDGYTDNLTAALPILEDARVPATLFITTAVLSEPEPFWWDELERLLLLPGVLPRTLRVSDGVQEHGLDLGNDAALGQAAVETHRHWSALQDEPPTRRHCVFLWLYEWMKPFSNAVRRNILQQIAAQAKDLQISGGCEAMSRNQLQAASASAMATIGGHTASHPFLSRLSRAEQEQEIVASKRFLEQTIGHEVRHFAYPHGDQSPETVSLVRDAGYRLACTTADGPVPPGSDRLRLPRITVGNWPRPVFERHLRNLIESN